MFIAFEGPDGAGIGTQARLLVGWLKESGKGVLLTKEPTDSLIGGLIKAALGQEWKCSARTLQLLFVADRSEHVQRTILPALQQGRIVLCDRYVLSTYCYGLVQGLELEWLRSLNRQFPIPELTLILDAPVEVCMQRIKSGRIKLELFEQKEVLERVRENYLKLSSEFTNTFVIDANKSMEEVQGEIREVVGKFVKIQQTKQ